MEKKCSKSDLEIENKKLKQELEEIKHKLATTFNLNPYDIVSFMTKNKDTSKQPINININITNTYNYNNQQKIINLTDIKYPHKYYPEAPISQKSKTSKKIFSKDKKQLEDINKDNDSLEIITDDEGEDDDNEIDSLEIITDDEDENDENDENDDDNDIEYLKKKQ